MDYKAHITRPENQVNNMDITQLSRIEKYEIMVERLASLGIYIRLYSNSLQNIQHPDGEHTYRKDATKAQKLLEDDKKLPQDLLDRLAYYKPIIDKIINEE